MTQRALRTSRLELEPLRAEHLELLVELDSDPEVLRYIAPRARTRTEVEASLTRRLARGDGHGSSDGSGHDTGLGYWAGFCDRVFVGQWILRPLLDDAGAVVPGEAELGYRLLRRWWRRGLAGEAARELLRHGFGDLDLTRVSAQTMAVNTASRALMSSLGMTLTRAFTEHFDDPVAGIEHGEVEYAITRADWARS